MMDLTFYLKGYSLSNTAMLVYGVLDGLARASASRGKAYTYISRKSLAERVGKCERTARKAVKELEAVGLVVIQRMGRGYNDHIFVNAPHKQNSISNEGGAMPKNSSPSALATQRTRSLENVAQVENVAVQERQKITALNNNTENFNFVIDKSINPETSKGYTAPKGKPTNRRPKRNIDEQRRLRMKYRELLENQIRIKELEEDYLFPRADMNAVKTSVDLVASAMASKGKIYVNGALLTPYQWWSVVQSISQDGLLRVINKMPRAKDVKNPRAYFLASIYNETVMEKMELPYFLESAY